jgi:predicted CXXCH cytochrome family protein
MMPLRLAAVALVLATHADSAASSDAPGARCGLRTTSRFAATSRTCRACHDGSIAIGVHGLTARGGDLSHPVDVSYDLAATRMPGRYRPRQAVSKAIWLPGGMVTCTSCHDGSSHEPGGVAMTLQRSALCLECHTI